MAFEEQEPSNNFLCMQKIYTNTLRINYDCIVIENGKKGPFAVFYWEVSIAVITPFF